MDEQTKIAHLLRRAGFGAGPEQLQGYLQKGLAATANELLEFENVADNLNVTLAETGLNDPMPVRGYVNDLPRWWLNTMSSTTRPLQEKMVLFWHHLFATGADKDGLDFRAMYLQNQMFRGNYMNGVPAHADSFPVGGFRKILEDLAKDPAMLFFLDNWINVKVNAETSSNENWGRELLELFSLGVTDVVTGEPNYTETDVKQVARSFTGWSLHLNPPDNFRRRFEFQPRGERGAQIGRVHDYGPYTLSSHFNNAVGGHLDPAGGGWVLDRICERRSAGRFITFRLFSFFGYDNPETGIIESLTDVYFASGYSIRAILEAMFIPGSGPAAEAFYSDKALKAKVKSPLEFVVVSWRMLGGLQFPARLTEELINSRGGSRSLNSMGQMPFYPPDVSGWDEGLEWINTTFDIARFNYANLMATLPSAQGGIAIESILSTYNLKTPEQIVDHFANRLLQEAPTTETRDNLINYMRAQDNGTPAPTFVLNQTTIDKKVRGLIHLILSTPAFQLN